MAKNIQYPLPGMSITAIESYKQGDVKQVRLDSNKFTTYLIGTFNVIIYNS